MKRLCLSLLVFFQFCFAENIKVLIVDGFNNHNSSGGTKALTSILEAAGGFTIKVSTVPDPANPNWKDWNPDFDQYEVIIQNTNSIKNNGKWTPAAQKGLEAFLSRGGGMYGFHSANNAFPQWKEYNKMIGLGWRNKDFGKSIHIKDGKLVEIPKGKGENTNHGKKVDTTVIKFGNHPIHADMPAQWQAQYLEIYRYARGPAENLTILSYAKEPKTGLNFPIEWATTYGQGRVYLSTYGHLPSNNPHDLAGVQCPSFIKILPKAITWLAGRE